MSRKIVIGFLVLCIGIGCRVPVEVSAVEVSTVEVPVNVITDNFEDAEFTQSQWVYIGTAGNPVADVAESNNEVMQLTGSRTSQAGSIWLKQNVSPPFDVTFRYRMLDSSSDGADGIVFMFNKGSNTSPVTGGGLGFDTNNGYGVEFDTWDNDGIFAPDSNSHIALFQQNPLNKSNRMAYSDQDNVQSESWKYVRIEVRSASVQVYWGDNPVLGTSELVLNWSGEALSTTFSGVGFTASTGAEWSKHQIDDVSITQYEEVVEEDTTPPVITLNGEETITIEQGTTFVDPGAIVTDNLSEVLEVFSSGTVDTSNPGTYTITYNATDAAGNHAITKSRTVEVVQGQAPVINLNGDEFVIVEQDSDYSESGATVTDNVDQNLLVVVSGLEELSNKLNQSGSGKYTITYSATDHSGRMAEEVTRTVVVVDRNELIENITEHEDDKLDISNIFQFISHHSGLFGDHNLRAEEIRYLLSLVEPIYSRVADN